MPSGASDMPLDRLQRPRIGRQYGLLGGGWAIAHAIALARINGLPSCRRIERLPNVAFESTVADVPNRVDNGTQWITSRDGASDLPIWGHG